MSADSVPTEALLSRAAAGDLSAWGVLLARHQDRLARMVAFRLNPRLRGRLDAADVVQDAFADASAHPEDYFNLPPPVPALFLWLRGVVNNKLLELHRHHLGTRKRDADRERPLDVQPGSGPESGDPGAALCAHLTAGLTRPSVAAQRGEVRKRLAEAMRAMDPTDREVLALRHFEQLTTAETARSWRNSDERPKLRRPMPGPWPSTGSSPMNFPRRPLSKRFARTSDGADG